jgi:hypothetical protein
MLDGKSELIGEGESEKLGDQGGGKRRDDSMDCH